MVAFFSRWRAAARGAVPSPLVPRLDWKAPAFPPSHLSPASHLVHSSSSCVERHRTKRSTQIVHPARSCGRKTGYTPLSRAGEWGEKRKKLCSAKSIHTYCPWVRSLEKDMCASTIAQKLRQFSVLPAAVSLLQLAAPLQKCPSRRSSGAMTRTGRDASLASRIPHPLFKEPPSSANVALDVFNEHCRMR